MLPSYSLYLCTNTFVKSTPLISVYFPSLTFTNSAKSMRPLSSMSASRKIDLLNAVKGSPNHAKNSLADNSPPPSQSASLMITTTIYCITVKESE